MATRTIKPSMAPPDGGLSTVVSVTGTLIRYSFYLIGALTLGAIGVGMLYARSYRVQRLDETPAFHVAASRLDGKKVSTLVDAGRSIGRFDVRQYGQLYDRNFDFTIVLAQPPRGEPVERNFAREIGALAPLSQARAAISQNFHDLETRFGAVRAAEFSVDADGRRKLCLAYLSRFDTPAVFIKGWYCEANGDKPNADGLACLIDRLTLDAPLASKEAEAFLRERMARSSYCSATPVSQTYDSTRRSLSPPSRWSQPAPRR